MEDQDRFGVDALLPEDGAPEETARPQEQSAPKQKKTASSVAGVFEWLDPIVASVIVVVLAFTFLLRIVGIDGVSMNDTLEDRDRVIIYHLFYTPKVGDIVVISRNVSNDARDLDSGNGPIIKRVIAVEGDTVDIQFEDGVGFVYVNGVLRNEPYIKEYISQSNPIPLAIDFPAVVPEGCVFVMGDNRNNSLDSRSALIGQDGMIDTRYILGHAILRVYPFDKAGLL